jgi:hypothetical protein
MSTEMQKCKNVRIVFVMVNGFVYVEILSK